jgi:hypothetical protein
VTLRIPGRVAWPLWGLAMLLAATATALRAANHGVHSELVPGGRPPTPVRAAGRQAGGRGPGPRQATAGAHQAAAP